MKEYLFKGWSESLNRWVYGSYVYHPTSKDHSILDEEGSLWDVINKTVSQQIHPTGIFEGDILLYKSKYPGGKMMGFQFYIESTYTIHARESRYPIDENDSIEWGPWYRVYDGLAGFIDFLDSHNVNTIGNRYDNPELLEDFHG